MVFIYSSLHLIERVRRIDPLRARFYLSVQLFAVLSNLLDSSWLVLTHFWLLYVIVTAETVRFSLMSTWGVLRRLPVPRRSCSADASHAWQAALGVSTLITACGLAGTRLLDEAPEPGAPVGRQDNVVGAVEYHCGLRRSNRHRGRSRHTRPSRASGLRRRLKCGIKQAAAARPRIHRIDAFRRADDKGLIHRDADAAPGLAVIGAF